MTPHLHESHLRAMLDPAKPGRFWSLNDVDLDAIRWALDVIGRLRAERDDLLEACRGLLMCSLPIDVSGQRFVDAARKAVAKATGEQP